MLFGGGIRGWGGRDVGFVHFKNPVEQVSPERIKIANLSESLANLSNSAEFFFTKVGEEMY